MNSLENCEIEELLSRYNFLIDKYIPLTLELAEKLEKFGKYKQELQVLTTEFSRRGFNPDEKDSLQKMIQQEIDKRTTK